jgi:hypothetical protein
MHFFFFDIATAGLVSRLHHRRAEARMILTAENPAVNLYRVEVSGWDDNKAFFVENSHLIWGEEAGKQVTLNRGLTNGSVVFLRLLQPIGNDRSRPVPYQAELVAQNEEGGWQFRLHPVSSRPLHRVRTLPIEVATRQSSEMEQGSETD